jgi:hypothetical protein
VKAVAFPLAAILGAVLLIAILAVGRGARRQSQRLSVKSVLPVVLLCAVWCCQLAFPPMQRSREQFLWQDDMIVIGAWTILAGFYWRFRLFAPLVIHGGGLMFYGMFLAICWAANGTIEPALGEAGWLLSVGAFLGSLISFPFSIAVLLGRFIRGIRVSSEAASNDKPQSRPTPNRPAG